MLTERINIQFHELKKFILNCIIDLKGQNIVCLDVHEKSNIMDLIILCTGQSNRHVISIGQTILYKSRNIGIQLYGEIEGIKFGEWVLIDLGDIIIHIMQKEIRNLYDLEKIWS